MHNLPKNYHFASVGKVIIGVKKELSVVDGFAAEAIDQ